MSPKRSTQPPNPTLALARCPSCRQSGARVSVTGRHSTLYLSCFHCGGRVIGGKLTARYLDRLPAHAIDFSNHWTERHLALELDRYRDRFWHTRRFPGASTVPEHPSDAMLVVRCFGCNELKGYLKMTEKQKPYVQMPCCNGRLMGIKMSLRYLSGLDWDTDLVFLETGVGPDALDGLIAQHG